MKFEVIKPGMYVEDTWFWDWGIGKVIKKLKTVAHINFAHRGIIVYDKSHTQFLKKALT